MSTKISAILFSMAMLFLLMPTLGCANNLGTMGDTYPIIEVDLLVLIKQRMLELKENGQWKKMMIGLQQQAVNYRDRPFPVKNIIKTAHPRVWHFDPSIVLDKSVYAPDGRLIALAGTHINPLARMNLSKTLIFFDGDDENQVRWVIAKDQALLGHTKLIMVKGSLLQLEKRLHKPVYFDQEGRLTNRFGIHQIPAFIIQEGVGLKIAEVLP